MRVVLLVLVACLPASAILYNIDQPVPVSLAHGEYYVDARLWGEGGALVRFGVGLFDRVTLGMSYGGNRFLGNDTIRPYPRPEFQARLAILSEDGYIPALVLGFESQGYDDTLGTSYQTLPRGGYLCAGKTIAPIRTFVQVGVSYWSTMDAFVVANCLLPGNVELIAEYDPALNDRRDIDDYWRGGLLNFGVGWTFAEKVRLVLGLRDIIGNRPETHLSRILEISINDHF
jgi:hypothetical protein